MEQQQFGDYTEIYDSDFTNSHTGRLQRQRVWQLLLPLLNPAQTVLEINCGSGEEALFMAPRVKRVMATDGSAAMITQAKTKLKSTKAELYFQQIPLQNLAGELRSNTFHFIFSGFGGLNCIDSSTMAALSKDLKHLLTDQGRALFIVMGRQCIWEKLYFLLKGEKQNAARRRANWPVEASIQGQPCEIWYYSPAELKAIFAEDFTVEYVRPIGLFLPPSYLESFFSRNLWLLNVLNVLEKLFARFGYQGNKADHYAILLRRR